MRGKEFRRFFDRHFHHVADRFVAVKYLKRLRIVTFTAAVFARHIATRQKIHLQFDHTLTLASLATTAFGVERESARGIAAHAGDRQLRVKIPDLVEHLDVGARRRTGRFPDRRLIDLVNGFDLLRATNQFEQIAISCAFSFFQLVAHRRPNYLVHQCRFTAAGNSCDH